MKKEMQKKINGFKNRALMWSDIEGADELKDDFDKFNACYKIANRDSYCHRDENIFHFCNDLVRHMYNKPFCSAWVTIPEELAEYYDRVLNKMNNFIERGTIAAVAEGFLPRWNRSFGYDENNMALEVAGYASYNHSFKEEISFKIEEDGESKTITFEIWYGDLVAKRRPFFFTMINSKDKGNQRFLPERTVIRAFWEKWNIYQFQTLTMSEYEEMLSDFEIVKADPLTVNEEA